MDRKPVGSAACMYDDPELACVSDADNSDGDDEENYGEDDA
jgi:hypothetical protein